MLNMVETSWNQLVTAFMTSGDSSPKPEISKARVWNQPSPAQCLGKSTITSSGRIIQVVPWSTSITSRGTQAWHFSEKEIALEIEDTVDIHWYWYLFKWRIPLEVQKNHWTMNTLIHGIPVAKIIGLTGLSVHVGRFLVCDADDSNQYPSVPRTSQVKSSDKSHARNQWSLQWLSFCCVTDYAQHYSDYGLQNGSHSDEWDSWNHSWFYGLEHF